MGLPARNTTRDMAPEGACQRDFGEMEDAWSPALKGQAYYRLRRETSINARAARSRPSFRDVIL